MKNGVAIKYGDIALGAKENFAPSMVGIEPFSDVATLQKNNLSFKNFGNPIEKYSVLLDGSALPFPSDTSGENFGIWSEQISGDDGSFESPLTLSFQATELFTSSGITLTFDEEEGIYPIDVVVSWWRGEEKIAEESFEPDSAKYFFNKKVEYYDGLEFRFSRLNLPYNRLKIHSIDYGIGVVFYGDELRGVQISNKIDPISTKIEINTCGFTIDSKKNVEYSFQTQQPISVYFNGNLQSKMFVKQAKRTSKKNWNVQTEDYIGLMDSIPYSGGVFFDANAEDVIDDIFLVAKVPYSLDDSFVGKKISGYIPYSNCRNALMQVCFSIGAVVKTSESEVVEIISLDNVVSQTIEKKRIAIGQSYNEKSVVTALELTAHFYKESQETQELYDASKSGIGERIFVKFNEPFYDLSISLGEIIESGANYAVINAESGCVLVGKKYQHTTVTKKKTNPIVSSSDIENVVSISSATLVSGNNVDTLLDSCYNYVVNSKDIKTKIIDGKHTNGIGIVKYGNNKYGSIKYGEEKNGVVTHDNPTMVGDLVTIPVEFYGLVSARIVSQKFSLVGGIIVKDSELR